VIIQVGKQEFRTKTHQNGGKKPKWNEKHTFEVDAADKEEIKLDIYDEDTMTDDYNAGC